jgi:hypothetical protein
MRIVLRALKAAFTLAALAIVSVTASAGIVDQQNIGPSSPDPNGVFAQANQTVVQTITVGITGQLDEIDLQVGEIGTPSDPLDLAVYQTVGGNPNQPAGPDLVSIAFAPSFFPASTAGFTAIDLMALTGKTISVTAGEGLAIELSSLQPSLGSNAFYTWNITQDNAYARGSLYNNSSSGGPFDIYPGGDAGFRTYVAPSSVPEPSSLVLLTVALAGLGWYGARRRSLAAWSGGGAERSR